MGLYSDNDLPFWPSRVLVVWAKVMKTTRIGSARAETASEHAMREYTYDVIKLPLFSHLLTSTQALRRSEIHHDEDAPATAAALSHGRRSCRPSLDSFSRLF